MRDYKSTESPGLYLRNQESSDGQMLLMIIRGNKVLATVSLTKDEVINLANELYAFIDETVPKPDPCKPAVDTTNISATEIRGLWNTRNQRATEANRFLNQIQKGVDKIEYVFGQVLESMVTARDGQQVRDEALLKVIEGIKEVMKDA